MDERLKIAVEDDFKDVTDLYDKMRKLQKHQAFHGEIVANTDKIDSIQKVRHFCFSASVVIVLHYSLEI